MGRLETIFPTTDVRNSEFDIDIVFVHGLNPWNRKDHARSTWSHPNGTFWPADLLPRSVPRARILLFAYNSNVAFNVATGTIRSHATSLLEQLLPIRNDEVGDRTIPSPLFDRTYQIKRHMPIIFVCHSLGGVLVKQALVIAKAQSDRYEDLRKSTTGLTFFGTPHAGGNKAAMGKVLANILSVFTGQPRNNLLSTLEKKSLYHEVINDDFNPQLNDFEVVSYCEERPTSIKIRHWAILPQASRLVVDRYSAKLGSPGEILIGLDAAHSDICRFTGEKDDGLYQLVEGHIQELAKKARSRRSLDVQGHTVDQDNRDKPPTRYYIVPYNQSPHFVGEESVLKFLSDVFSPGNRIRRAALSGIGGVGKTQYAVQYCLLRREQGSGDVFWVNAETDAALTTSFRNICEDLSLDHKMPPERFFRSWLKKRKDWLLVFDNVNESTLRIILQLTSQTDAGDVLITTRDSHIIGSQGFPYGQELSKLDELNSMLLWVLNSFPWAPSELEGIRKIFVEPETVSLCKDSLPSNIAPLAEYYQISKFSQLRSIVSWAGFLPLAVVQCASYLRQYPTSYSHFIQLFNSRLLETRRNFFSHVERGATYDASIMTVWETTFRELQHTLPQSAELLTLLGFLDRNLISEDFLRDCLHDMQIWEGLATLSLDVQHQSSLSFLDNRHSVFDRSLGRLITLSLVTKSREKRRIILHPMVHEWVHLRMSKVQCREWLERALILLCHRVPPLLYSSADKSVPGQAEYAFCHLERVSEMFGLYLDDAEELAVECAVFFLEAYLWYQGDRYLDIAEKLIRSTESSAQTWVARMIYGARLQQVIQKFQESRIHTIDQTSYDEYSSKLSLASKSPSTPPPGTRFEITRAVIANRLCETLDRDIVLIRPQRDRNRSTELVSEGTRTLLGSVPHSIFATQPLRLTTSSVHLVCSALLALCRAKDHLIYGNRQKASQLLEQFQEGAALSRRSNLEELAQYFNILIRTKAACQPDKYEYERLLRYIDRIGGAEILVQEWVFTKSVLSGPSYAGDNNAFISILAERPEFAKCFPDKGAFKDLTEEEKWTKRRLFAYQEHFGPIAVASLDCAERLSSLYQDFGSSKISEAKGLSNDIFGLLKDSGELVSKAGSLWAHRLWNIFAEDNGLGCSEAIALCKTMISAYMDDYQKTAPELQLWAQRLGDALGYAEKNDESLEILCNDMLALWTDKENESSPSSLNHVDKWGSIAFDILERRDGANSREAVLQHSSRMLALGIDMANSSKWSDLSLLKYVYRWGLLVADIIERLGDSDSQEAFIQHCFEILHFFRNMSSKKNYRYQRFLDRDDPADPSFFSHDWATKMADKLEKIDKQRWVDFCAATSAHFEAKFDITDEICEIWAAKINAALHGKVNSSDEPTVYNEEMDRALCIPTGNIWDWTCQNIQLCTQKPKELLSLEMVAQRLGFDKGLEKFFPGDGLQESPNAVPCKQPKRVRLSLGAVVGNRWHITRAWHLGNNGGLWIAQMFPNVHIKESLVSQEVESLLLWVRPSIVGVTYVSISPELTLYKTNSSVLSTLRILDCGNEKSEIFFRFQSNQEADSFSNAFVAAKGQIAIRPFERED